MKEKNRELRVSLTPPVFISLFLFQLLGLSSKFEYKNVHLNIKMVVRKLLTFIIKDKVIN